LLVPKPLVYRTVHSSNAFLTADLFSMEQSRQRVGAEQWYPTCRRDVVEAMFHNGVASIFDPAFLSSMLKIHFTEDEVALLRAASPHIGTFAPPPRRAAAPAEASRPTSAPEPARKSFLSRGWRRLRTSGRRWAAAALGTGVNHARTP
jgi:hypothetical protein